MNSLRVYLFAAALLITNLCYANGVTQSFATPEEESAEQSLGRLHVDELWDLANTDYANSNFIGAERAYREILNRGVHSAALYYNLGNVHHKRGAVGESLLYYYKALRLAPSDSDILHNIEVVKAKTTDNIESMPRLFLIEWSEWLGSRLSGMEWSILSLVLFAVALGLLMLYLLAESMRTRRIGFMSTLICGVIFVMATHFAIEDRKELLNPSEAIVMSRAISVKSSPNRAATELFILHEGTKVEVVTTHENWYEIKLDDGKKGWVESSRVERI